MKKITTYSILALLMVLIGGIGFGLNQLKNNIKISCVNETGCASLSPYGRIEFEFSKPVNQIQAEAAFFVVPNIEGFWQWTDNQHGIWVSMYPLPKQQTIKFGFTAEKFGQNQEKLPGSTEWEAFVRETEIIFLSAQEPFEIFKINTYQPEQPKQLTFTQGMVYDFSPSMDGGKIVYSVINPQQGIDLWLMDRDGNNQTQVLNCERDRCTSPNWSFSSEEILYIREVSVNQNPLRYTNPQPWILTLNANHTQSLFQSELKAGFNPKFSPNAQWVSFSGEFGDSIELLNRVTGQTIILQSAGGGSGSWSKDGNFLFHDQIIQIEEEINPLIVKTSIDTSETTIFINQELIEEGIAFKNPLVNPVNGNVIISMSPNKNSPGNELWYLNSKGDKVSVIEDNPSTITSFYSWDPYGEALLYKSFDLQDSSNSGNLYIWNLNGDHETININIKINSPYWLP